MFHATIRVSFLLRSANEWGRTLGRDTLLEESRKERIVEFPEGHPESINARIFRGGSRSFTTFLSFLSVRTEENRLDKPSLSDYLLTKMCFS